MRTRQSTKAAGFHPCSVPDLSPFPRKSCSRGFKAFHGELSSSSYQMALSLCQHPISTPAVSPHSHSPGRPPLSTPSSSPPGSAHRGAPDQPPDIITFSAHSNPVTGAVIIHILYVPMPCLDHSEVRLMSHSEQDVKKKKATCLQHLPFFRQGL